MADHPDQRRSAQGLPPVLLVSLAVCVGCDFPLSSTKYTLVDGGAQQINVSFPGAPTASSDLAGSPEDVKRLGKRADVGRLLGAFTGDETCSVAFLENCTGAVEDCAERDGCVDFAECVRERASPAAETTCADDLGTSLRDHWHYEVVRHCWSTRYAECEQGNDFSCVGEYATPSSERSEVYAVQQLQAMRVIGGSELPTGMQVRFCERLTDCTKSFLIAEPNAEGLYAVKIPVGSGNSGPGNSWNGYRIVEDPGDNLIVPSIVESNIPVWGQRVEITRLLSKDTIELFDSIYKDYDAYSTVFVQTVDCKSDPAAGILIELPNSPHARVDPVTLEGSLGGTATTVAGGAVGIYGHESGTPQRIIARKDGRIVGQYSGFLEPGMPRYIRLHPAGAELEAALGDEP